LRDPELTRTSVGAAITELAGQEQSNIVAAAYGGGIEDLVLVHLRTTVCARPPKRLRALSSATGDGLK